MIDFFRQHGRMAVLGLLLTVLVAWLHLTSVDWVRSAIGRLDYLTYDVRLQVAHQPVSENDLGVVIIDIDERSLAEYGRWPWSRLTIADLVVRLHQAGALVIGFDVSFPETERNVVSELLRSRHTESAEPAQLAWLKSLEPNLDRDALLAGVLPGRTVVLGFLFTSNPSEQAGQLPQPWFFIRSEHLATHQVPDMAGYSANLAVLQSAADYGGFLNGTPDDDGVLRRTPLVLRHAELGYPSLALAMARLYRNALAFKVHTTPVAGRQFVTGLQLDRRFIPTDRFGRVQIRYFGGEGTFPYVSAADVLGAASLDELPYLEGKAVIVGTSALGLYDLRNTPLQPAFPGVEVQASLLQTLISDEFTFPVRPDWEDALILLLILGLGILLSLAAPVMNPTGLVVLAAGLIGGIVGIDFWLWSARGISVSPVLPLLLVLALTAANVVRGFFSESTQRREIQDMFGQYVPAAHIDRMLSPPDRVSFEGETREMSVLFADIRNFTTISEGMDAVQLKSMLNEFFTPITRLIFASGGTVDKYIGDLVMAFWGAPLDDPDHRVHAIDTALAMLATVSSLRSQFRDKGYPEIQIGVGVNSGLMNVGDMGSSFRRAYTVIGDAVNLGSRLEGLTKFYGVSLLVGEETRDGAEDYLYRLIDPVQVKGKDRPVRIYEPICRREQASAELLAEVEQHTEAMRMYLKGMMTESQRLFEALQASSPRRQQEIMLERIAELSLVGTGAEWSGTFRHENK